MVRAPEDQAHRPRLGLIYFARPEAKITLAPVQSPLLERLGLQKGVEESLGNVTAEGMIRRSGFGSVMLTHVV